MESGGNGKRAHEEAGPSSGIDGRKLEMTEKASDDDKEEEEEEEEEEEGAIEDSKNGFFVPGPLLSLKEQIERDKVFMILTPFFFSRTSLMVYDIG